MRALFQRGLDASSPPPGEGMVHDEHYDGAECRNENAVHVEPGHPCLPELVEQKAPNQCADDTQHDIHDHPFARLVHNLAAQKPGNEAEKDPCENRHDQTPI